jgi:hypothetical protein
LNEKNLKKNLKIFENFFFGKPPRVDFRLVNWFEKMTGGSNRIYGFGLAFPNSRKQDIVRSITTVIAL